MCAISNFIAALEECSVTYWIIYFYTVQSIHNPFQPIRDYETTVFIIGPVVADYIYSLRFRNAEKLSISVIVVV